jgi:hypothetical protein
MNAVHRLFGGTAVGLLLKFLGTLALGLAVRMLLTSLVSPLYVGGGSRPDEPG